MLLNPPEDREPLRLKTVIVWPFKRDLEDYRQYFEELYGRPIDEADLLVELGLHAIETDTTFRRWQKKRRKRSLPLRRVESEPHGPETSAEDDDG